MADTTPSAPAAASGTFRIGGDLPVTRLGFGAMRITGEGIWGPPDDRDEALRVLRRAVALGVDFIDTAEAYGPHVSEELIAEALHPYPDGLVIATKGGLDRTGPGRWPVNGRPERLREQLEGSLRRLRVDTIDLWQLHRIDDRVPLAEQLGVVQEAQQEGKVRHFGLSEVTVAQLAEAREHLDVHTVQNRFNYADRAAEDVLEACERDGIGFIPWFPLAVGDLAREGSALAEAARRHDASPGQLALAWLLHRSPVMLPIPGTSRVAHLEDNVAAAGIRLTDEEFAAL
jgi:aryl-alcohol dehydrogenase-like predicted oxidoreductase